MPSPYSSVTRDRPREMPLRAYSALSFIIGGADARLERDAQRLVARHVALPELLERITRVLRARALGVEVGLLVAAAGDVVLEQPAQSRLLVEAREDRDHDQALHRGGQVHPDHLTQPVRLALQREVLALDLLVVLELGLEELRHLHGRAGGAGDAHA